MRKFLGASSLRTCFEIGFKRRKISRLNATSEACRLVNFITFLHLRKKKYTKEVVYFCTFLLSLKKKLSTILKHGDPKLTDSSFSSQSLCESVQFFDFCKNKMNRYLKNVFK